jgi:hypothetical protein
MIGTCGSCRHFCPELTTVDSAGQFIEEADGSRRPMFSGECRALPPRLVDDNLLVHQSHGTRIWPAVDLKDWCSFWAEREADE